MSGIGAVAGVTGVTPAGSLGDVAGTAGTTGAGDATSGASFSNILGQGLQSLESTQATADNLSVQAATGTLTNAHDLLIATTQAQLATQLTTTLRNKAVDAFNEIMRMQI